MKAYAQINGTAVVQKFVSQAKPQMENIVEMPMDKALSNIDYEFIEGEFVAKEMPFIPPIKTDAERIAELEAIIDTMLGGETV